MNLYDFGHQLLKTEDLDPVYVVLYKAKLPSDQLQRWLLAYWCFYHAGVASRASEAEGKDFWEILHDADVSRWPRGTERRHFRGMASRGAINYLSGRYPQPENAVRAFSSCLTFAEVDKIIEQWPGFGPWIAFKAADMLERVLGWPIRFESSLLSLYKEPRAAADLLGVSLEAAVTDLHQKFGEYSAPPSYERKVGIQEIETIMCKWKSHMNGHYPPGKDTEELKKVLTNWSQYSTTCERLLVYLPCQ